MGRKNTNARERVSSRSKDVQRLNRENAIFKAHKRREEFSMSYSIGSRIDELVAKRLSK